MALDIAALRKKLNELSNKTRVSDLLWKPQEGSNRVRIVPLKDSNTPYVEAYFHYLGGKTYLSPLTFGEPDPIEEFAQALRAGGNLSKEEWNETKKFMPKPRTFVPIVVRGKEAEGVRLWGFGKTTFKELLAIMTDEEEYGDITHVKTGRDIKVEFTPKEKSDTGFPKTHIQIAAKESELVSDKELLEKLVSSKLDVFEIYPRVSYDDLKVILNKYLTPATNTSEVAPVASENSTDWEEPGNDQAPTPSPSAEASKKSSSKSPKDVDAEFDAMFNN